MNGVAAANKYPVELKERAVAMVRERELGEGRGAIARIAELEKKNRESRRANEILKLASAFFAREMDPRQPR